MCGVYIDFIIIIIILRDLYYFRILFSFHPKLFPSVSDSGAAVTSVFLFVIVSYYPCSFEGVLFTRSGTAALTHRYDCQQTNKQANHF